MPRETAQLADEIAELLSPIPTEQPEHDEFVSSTQKSFGLLGDDDIAVQRPSARHMCAAIDMSSTGAKYAGRITTRDVLDRRHQLSGKPQRSEEKEEDSEDKQEEDRDKEMDSAGEEGEAVDEGFYDEDDGEKFDDGEEESKVSTSRK